MLSDSFAEDLQFLNQDFHFITSREMVVATSSVWNQKLYNFRPP